MSWGCYGNNRNTLWTTDCSGESWSTWYAGRDTASKRTSGDQLKMSRVQRVSEFHCQNPEALKHISTIDFTNISFHPITNLTDTPDTVPSDWAKANTPFKRGGKCKGLPSLTSIIQTSIVWAELSIWDYVIQPIPVSDPHPQFIISLGILSMPSYYIVLPDAVDTPQLDLWG